MELETIQKKVDTHALQRHGVSLALLFGSQVTGNRHPSSDADIGILFSNPEIIKENPVELYDDLNRAFGKCFGDTRLDIVYLHETPLRLQFEAVNEGSVLYESAQGMFVDYKERVVKMYLDFKCIEDIFHQTFLNAAVTV